MSSIGTGIASGVAQTSLQAQQVGRQQATSKAQRDNDARRIKDLIEAHLQALEEGDEDQTPEQLRIDGQVPEHQTDHRSDGQVDHLAAETPGNLPADTPEEAPGANPPEGIEGKQGKPGRGDSGLYQHLDVKA